MREIKFRAWIKERKYYEPLRGFNQNTNTCWYTLYTIPSGYFSARIPQDVTLEQFTGLKDKNGVEIFEGDILSADDYPFIDDGKQNYVAVVEWVFAGFQMVMKCVNPEKRGISNGINDYLEESEGFEIIGNIHENKDLLK